MSDSFVTVHRTTDPVEAEIVVDLLAEEGIEPHLYGAQSVALVPVERRVDVAAGDADRAKELVTAFLASRAEDVPDEDSGPEEEEAPRKLSPMLGIGVAMLVPGGCHFYARRIWTGAAIAASQVALIVFAMSERADRSAASAAGVAFAGLALFDMLFGQAAVRAHNRGVRRGTGRQLGYWLAASVVIVCAALPLGDLLAHLKPPRSASGAAGKNQLRAFSPDDNESPPLPGLDLKLR
jgi:hypothetical protein